MCMAADKFPYLESIRWRDGFVCPKCASTAAPTRIAKPGVLRCKKAAERAKKGWKLNRSDLDALAAIEQFVLIELTPLHQEEPWISGKLQSLRGGSAPLDGSSPMPFLKHPRRVTRTIGTTTTESSERLTSHHGPCCGR